MPVGHGGDESKHPAWVKIAILEFIEARFKDIVENDDDLKDEFRAKLIQYLEDCDVELSESEINRIVDAKVADYYVKVYDPFSTEMDFYILFNVDWPKYLELYSKYYSEDDPKIKPASLHLSEVLDNYPSPHPIYALKPLIEKAVRTTASIQVYDEVFNASRSKSVIFYTIQQMKNILDYGHP
jgi:hypothetical protein